MTDGFGDCDIHYFKLNKKFTNLNKCDAFLLNFGLGRGKVGTDVSWVVQICTRSEMQGISYMLNPVHI
jgi:hypothetical protein